MTTRVARVVRGLIASSVAVFVAAFAHVAGGGAIPGLAPLALAFSFCALASIALAGRRVRAVKGTAVKGTAVKGTAVRLSATVILSQGIFHLLFLMSGGTATSLPSSPGMQPGMHMDATPTVVTAAGPAMIEDGWMWLAHGFAAVITVVALLWGERAFWKLFETVTRALRVWFGVVRQAQGPVPPIQSVRVLASEFLLAWPRRRGPPHTLASI